MRNLELVQAHSLFTFMGRMTDGLGSFLQSSLAEQSYHVVKKFACVGVLTSLRQSVHAQTFTPAYARTHPFRKTLMKAVCCPSRNQSLMQNPLPSQHRYRWRWGKSGASR